MRSQQPRTSGSDESPPERADSGSASALNPTGGAILQQGPSGTQSRKPVARASERRFRRMWEEPRSASAPTGHLGHPPASSAGCS